LWPKLSDIPRKFQRPAWAKVGSRQLLAWLFRRYGMASRSIASVPPSDKNVDVFLEKYRTVFHEMRAHAQSKVIWKPNPIRRGWTNSRKTVASKRSRALQDAMEMGKTAISCERGQVG